MSLRRWMSCLLLTSSLVLGWTATASALVPCGQPETGGGQATVGELSLDPISTPHLNQDFGRKQGERDMGLILSVEGCTLAQGADIKVQLQDDEHDAIEIVAIAPKGDAVAIDAKVVADRFAPGTHHPTLTVYSPSGQVKRASFEVTLRRQEPPLIPTVVAVGALLFGLVYAFLLAIWSARESYDKQRESMQNPPPAGDKVEYKPSLCLTALAAALGAAFTAYKTGYADSSAWSGDGPAYIVLFIAVATAAAGGAAVGLAKGITAAVVPGGGGPPGGPAPAPQPLAAED